MELRDIWPAYALSITAGDLSLRFLRDEDIPPLVDLALTGIHDAARMPFYEPWTDAPPHALPAAMATHYWRQRASFSPAAFSLLFVVRRAEVVLGIQAISTSNFSVTRTGETGSWLGQRFQGQGVGTRMRRMVCAFAFDHFGFAELTSGAFLDNPSSLAVSRKVGYVDNGITRMERRTGELAHHQRFLLTPETFVRGEPIHVTGAPEVLRFLDLPTDPP